MPTPLENLRNEPRAPGASPPTRGDAALSVALACSRRMPPHDRSVSSTPSPRTRSSRRRAAHARPPAVRAIAALAFAGSLAACGSTGDTGELLLEGTRACSAVCASHPDVDAFSYRAGGGAPLLFLGAVEASCECAATPRGTGSPMSALEDGLS